MPLGDNNDFSILFGPQARSRLVAAALRGEKAPPVGDELAQALERSRGAGDLANLLAASGDTAMGQLAHGIRAQAEQDTQAPEQRLRYARESEQTRQLQDRAERMRDPGSPATALRRTLAKKWVPEIDASQMTGMDLEPDMPLMERSYAADLRRVAAGGRGAGGGGGAAARKSAPVEDVAADPNDPFAGRPADNMAYKGLDKLLKDLGKDLDPFVQARSAFGQNAQTVRKAKALQQLLAHGNNLDPRQREEIAIGLAALLGGSSAPAEGTIKNLVPHSLIGDAMGMAEWFMNEPLGTNQQKFIERIADTIDREEKTALAGILEEQKGVIPKHQVLFGVAPRAAWNVLRARGLDKYYGTDFQPLQAPAEHVGAPAAPGHGATPAASGGPAVVETRTINGRKLEKLSDGSIREVK